MSTLAARVGNTPLTEHVIDGRALFLKREDMNPTGTHKDRRAQKILEAAEGTSDVLTLLTAGNAGYSLTCLSQEQRTIVNIVDHSVAARIKEHICREGGMVIEETLHERLSAKAIVGLAQRAAAGRVRNVTNGYIHAFHDIIRELLEMNPDVIIAPLGSGELFLGLHEGLEMYGSEATLMGVTVVHPKSRADKLTAPWTPYKRTIEEVCRERNRVLKILNEDEVLACEQLIPDGVPMEPSAAVIFAGLAEVHERGWKIVVGINTGKPLYARD